MAHWAKLGYGEVGAFSPELKGVTVLFANSVDLGHEGVVVHYLGVDGHDEKVNVTAAMNLEENIWHEIGHATYGLNENQADSYALMKMKLVPTLYSMPDSLHIEIKNSMLIKIKPTF